jgi:hypothetical protein
MNNEILHKEIDLIQSVITRMANNSFLLKGWLISLIAVVLALSKDNWLADKPILFCLLLSFPILIFWYLDAFFLHRERCFRKLYDWVIQNRATSNDFLYSLDFRRFENETIFNVMKSQTLLVFYGLILVVLFIFVGIIVLSA